MQHYSGGSMRSINMKEFKEILLFQFGKDKTIAKMSDPNCKLTEDDKTIIKILTKRGYFDEDERSP